jgi:hypothetical protein
LPSWSRIVPCIAGRVRDRDLGKVVQLRKSESGKGLVAGAEAPAGVGGAGIGRRI